MFSTRGETPESNSTNHTTKMIFLNSFITELLPELRLAPKAKVDYALARFAPCSGERSTNWPRQECSPHRARLARKTTDVIRVKQESIADFLVNENVCTREQAEFAKLVQAALSLLTVLVQNKILDKEVVTKALETFDNLQNSEDQQETAGKTQAEKASATILKGFSNLKIALMPILGQDFLDHIHPSYTLVRIAF
jgi:acyl-CoA reductase-like NAD-dependent aldehyde dehydrogenase